MRSALRVKNSHDHNGTPKALDLRLSLMRGTSTCASFSFVFIMVQSFERRSMQKRFVSSEIGRSGEFTCFDDTTRMLGFLSAFIWSLRHNIRSVVRVLSPPKSAFRWVHSSWNRSLDSFRSDTALHVPLYHYSALQSFYHLCFGQNIAFKAFSTSSSLVA